MSSGVVEGQGKHVIRKKRKGKKGKERRGRSSKQAPTREPDAHKISASDSLLTLEILHNLSDQWLLERQSVLGLNPASTTSQLSPVDLIGVTHT